MERSASAAGTRRAASSRLSKNTVFSGEWLKWGNPTSWSRPSRAANSPANPLRSPATCSENAAANSASGRSSSPQAACAPAASGKSEPPNRLKWPPSPQSVRMNPDAPYRFAARACPRMFGSAVSSRGNRLLHEEVPAAVRKSRPASRKRSTRSKSWSASYHQSASAMSGARRSSASGWSASTSAQIIGRLPSPRARSATRFTCPAKTAAGPSRAARAADFPRPRSTGSSQFRCAQPEEKFGRYSPSRSSSSA